MEKSRLIQLLRTFSKEEIRGFRKFLRSPYFTPREDLPLLFDYLAKFLKNGKEVPTKEEAFQKLFPKDSFHDHRLRMLMSFLFQLAGQFLSVNGLLNDEVEFQKSLTASYRERGLAPHFEKAWKSLKESHQKSPYRNAFFFEEQYGIYLEKYQTDSGRRSIDLNYLHSLEEQLDKAYVTRKLWQACFLLSHKTMRNTDFDFGMLPLVLDYINQKKWLGEPAISIYYYCYLALTEPESPNYFQKFKSLIFEKGQLFPNDELRDLYILAINFCIKKYNAGKADYLKEQFDLYRDGFDKSYFLVGGNLSHITYQNAVTIGLVMEEYKWVEEFISTYQLKLKREYQESVYSFNRARLEYEKGKHSEALGYLQKAEYKDLMLNLAARSLQMKIYFELGENDLLDAHLGAFKIFLKRKKELGYHRENYLNTILLTKKILELNPFDKKEKIELKKEIEQVQRVGEKEWLLKVVI